MSARPPVGDQVARARGLLALACGDVDGALAHVDEGIRAVGTAGAQLAWLRYHRARTLLARRSRRWTDEARDLLDEARATAVSSGDGALAPILTVSAPTALNPCMCSGGLERGAVVQAGRDRRLRLACWFPG